MTDRPRVVAAIDFGTYGSGFAWMVVDPSIADTGTAQIFHRNTWPANEDISAAKTRTALLVVNGVIEAYGSQAYQVARDRRAQKQAPGVIVEDFKVALKAGPSGYKISGSDRALNSLQLAGLSVDEAVTDYLRWLYGQALGEMERSRIRPEDVEWCLTVPAIWDGAEKDRMRQAAVAAGMPGDRLTLALEPEAAAIYVYYAQLANERDRFDLEQAGARFMVVDGGGGTMDITAYKVADGGGLAEIGKATGERLGSQYLNQGFIELLGRHLGISDPAGALDDLEAAGFNDLLRNWDLEKRHVKLGRDTPVEVPLGVRLNNKLDRHMKRTLARTQNGIDDVILVTPAEVEEIFSAVVGPTLDFIDAQLTEMADYTKTHRAPESIVLAGGFSASPYLQEAIRRRVSGRATVAQAPHPEIAVLHGAVQFARTPMVTKERRVTSTWGIAATVDFVEGEHDPSRRVTIGGREVCTTVFHTFVQEGDPVRPDEPVVQLLTPFLEEQEQVPIVLYSAREKRPRYVDSPGCSRAAAISIDISDMMHLPRESRGIKVEMFFGRTELEVRATNMLSEATLSVHVQYTYE